MIFTDTKNRTNLEQPKNIPHPHLTICI